MSQKNYINLTKALGNGRYYCPHCTPIKIQPDYHESFDPNKDRATYKWSKYPIWLVIKKGKYGSFYACPNWTKTGCTFTLSVSKRTGRVNATSKKYEEAYNN